VLPVLPRRSNIPPKISLVHFLDHAMTLDMSDAPYRESGRLTPAKGVRISLGRPNWVFLTACTDKRGRWLAQPSVQRALHAIWENTATAWLVSDYLLMPDHLHLFCAPRDLKFTIERWVAFWKDRFAKTDLDIQAGHFQPAAFHHRLRERGELCGKMAICPRKSGQAWLNRNSRRLALLRTCARNSLVRTS
jgi:hypothetical protein